MARRTYCSEKYDPTAAKKRPQESKMQQYIDNSRNCAEVVCNVFEHGYKKGGQLKKGLPQVKMMKTYA